MSYQDELPQMKKLQALDAKRTAELHMSIVANAMALANKKARPWFFVDCVLCDEVLAHVQKEFRVTYFRHTCVQGKHTSKHVYVKSNPTHANAMRLHLINTPAFDDQAYSGLENPDM